MKKRTLSLIIILSLLLSQVSCNKSDSANWSSKPKKNSTFSIHFIDVGQGDSALVECDGKYMLIDGGGAQTEEKLYRVFQELGKQKLDILAISHMHEDHIGGLENLMGYVSSIDMIVSNTDYSDSKVFRELENEIHIIDSKITIPRNGEKYKLGSAIIEVIDVSAKENNDSLVLMITYGETKFLFTGDIEESAQTRISNKYENENDEAYDIDLIKMPHHGSYTGTLYRFIRTFMPEYAVISVGKDNKYGHPHRETMGLLDNKKRKIQTYRTDIDGDIIVRSNGRELSFETSK